MMNKIEYKELSKAKVSESRNIIISECSKGGFTVAQQVEVKGDKKTDQTIMVFLKGAFHIDELNGLYNLRDCINLAIEKVECAKIDDCEWED